jgi:hypothetical protein
MAKKILILGLLLVILCLPLLAEEQQPEEFVITTYYPSPYGSYNELEVYRSVTYKPLSSLPATNLKQGELVYVDSNPADSKPGQFYYYGGAGWVAQGAGTVIYTPACSWSSSGGILATCDPPQCAQGYTSLGTGCKAFGGLTTSATSSSSCIYRPVGDYGHDCPYLHTRSGDQCCTTVSGGGGSIAYGYCERYCAKD